MDEIYYHRYTLVSNSRLNVKSSRTQHEGILLRVGEGYGCIHPWQVFGDASVEQQLEALSEGSRTRLITRALDCARMDAKARKAGVSLFNNIRIPNSHATITDDENGVMKSVEDAANRGFLKIKIKAGGDFKVDAQRVNDIAKHFPQLKMRVDFNCHLMGSEVGDFVELLKEESRERIDFLEDPCGYKEGCWSGLRDMYGIKLAMDIGVESVDALYSYAILKPAKNNVHKVMESARSSSRKVAVTSYMDHPIGQAFAAYEAGNCLGEYPGLMTEGGLMTHGLFEKNAFIEELGEVQPEWKYNQGTGLGFDTLLENLEWKKV